LWSENDPTPAPNRRRFVTGPGAAGPFLPPGFCTGQIHFGFCFRIGRAGATRCAHGNDCVMDGLGTASVFDDLDLCLFRRSFGQNFRAHFLAAPSFFIAGRLPTKLPFAPRTAPLITITFSDSLTRMP